jgi:hypothetical protein
MDRWGRWATSIQVHNSNNSFSGGGLELVSEVGSELWGWGGSDEVDGSFDRKNDSGVPV